MRSSSKMREKRIYLTGRFVKTLRQGEIVHPVFFYHVNSFVIFNLVRYTRLYKISVGGKSASAKEDRYCKYGLGSDNVCVRGFCVAWYDCCESL